MVVIKCKYRTTDTNYCHHYCKQRTAECDQIIADAVKASSEPEVLTPPLDYKKMTNYFRQFCFACDYQNHCEGKSFSSCKLRKDKWETCPKGFWTEETWNQALKTIGDYNGN